jgi:hypothetical protein
MQRSPFRRASFWSACAAAPLSEAVNAAHDSTSWKIHTLFSIFHARLTWLIPGQMTALDTGS